MQKSFSEHLENQIKNFALCQFDEFNMNGNSLSLLNGIGKKIWEFFNCIFFNLAKVMSFASLCLLMEKLTFLLWYRLFWWEFNCRLLSSQLVALILEISYCFYFTGIIFLNVSCKLWMVTLIWTDNKGETEKRQYGKGYSSILDSVCLLKLFRYYGFSKAWR